MSSSINEMLFVERTMHRPILVTGDDRPAGSRHGGKPPVPLAAAPPRCPVCRGPLIYVLTLAGDTLGEALAGGRALSLLACRDYACLSTSHKLTEPSSTVLIVHDDTQRATQMSQLDGTTEGCRLTLGHAMPDPLHERAVYTDASKLGGGPGYIQSWGPNFDEIVERRGGGFLFQWSENSVTSGRFVFSGGVAYVFCGINRTTRLPELRDLASFWQST